MLSPLCSFIVSFVYLIFCVHFVFCIITTDNLPIKLLVGLKVACVKACEIFGTVRNYNK